jgi:hypothetical protein
MKKFFAKRWLEGDLAGVLTAPIAARWAAPHRLPSLPMRTPALAGERAQRAHAATA